MAGHAIPLNGLKFGKLTVTEYLGHQLWRTQCDCGGTRDLSGRLLRGGSAKACFTCTPPKSKGRPRAEDLTGETYHQLRVDRYLGASIYRCVCSCGNTREVPGSALKNGSVRRCEDCRKALTATTRADNAAK